MNENFMGGTVEVSFFSPETIFLIFIFFAIALAILSPIPFFLIKIWPQRRESFLSRFNKKSELAYFKVLHPAKYPQQTNAGGELSGLKTIYDHIYSRPLFLFWYLVLALLIVPSLVWIFSTVGLDLQVWPKQLFFHHPMKEMAMSAFSGGLMWVMIEQVRRCRTGDFTGHDVHGFIFRLIICVPLGYCLAPIFSDNVGVPAAFILGIFPTNKLLKLANRQVIKRFEDEKTEDASAVELGGLQGLNPYNIERLQEENISSILGLAYADPIDLSIRTGVDFILVIDYKSQALLRIYFEANQINILNKYGLRGAQELDFLWETYLDKEGRLEDTKKYNAEKIVESLAKDLEMDLDLMRFKLLQVAEDPHAIFLHELWLSYYPDGD